MKKIPLTVVSLWWWPSGTASEQCHHCSAPCLQGKHWSLPGITFLGSLDPSPRGTETMRQYWRSATESNTDSHPIGQKGTRSELGSFGWKVKVWQRSRSHKTSKQIQNNCVFIADKKIYINFMPVTEVNVRKVCSCTLNAPIHRQHTLRVHSPCPLLPAGAR